MSDRRLRLRRIEARDRRMAAIHEAGHLTMARHVGLHAASASLEKIQDASTSIMDTRLWVGKTRYLQSGIIGKPLSYRKMAMFAVAGAVAESCWQRESFDEEFWYDDMAMSVSDWAGCKCEPGNPSPKLLKIIAETYSLFDYQTGQLWPVLLREAHRLIKSSRRST
jgi:hypothetical protein